MEASSTAVAQRARLAKPAARMNGEPNFGNCETGLVCAPVALLPRIDRFRTKLLEPYGWPFPYEFAWKDAIHGPELYRHNGPSMAANL